MSLIPAIVFALTTAQAADAPATLGRVFTPNELLKYSVRSNLQAERRGGSLTTWIPEDFDLNYDFTVQVEAMKADGIAVVRYKRPTMTEIEGESFDSAPKTKVDKVNLDFQLTVSPFNEILDMKDLTPKKPPTKKGVMAPALGAPQGGLDAFLGQFISEIYRLCLFAGSMDSALDFAPRSTFDNVKVGDTWKRTVGYQPQKLKGKDGQQAMQRLDYTYTYKGLVNGEKGKVIRVEGDLDFSTDLAEFVKQITGATSDQIGLEKVPLKLTAKILFDLDPKTRHTIKAEATSDASFQFFEPQKSDPAFEERMKGRTSMWLASRTIAKPATTTAPVKTTPAKGGTKKGKPGK